MEKTEPELRARLLELRKKANQLVYMSCPSWPDRRRKADLLLEIEQVKADLKEATAKASQIKTDSGRKRGKRGKARKSEKSE